MKNMNLFLTVLKSRSPRSGWQQGWVSLSADLCSLPKPQFVKAIRMFESHGSLCRIPRVIARLSPILQTKDFSRRTFMQSKIIITSTHAPEKQLFQHWSCLCFTNTLLFLFLDLAAC